MNFDEIDKLPPEIKRRCVNCDAKYYTYGEWDKNNKYVCHCGHEQIPTSITSKCQWISIKEKQPYAGQEILFCSIEKEFLPTTFGIYLGDNFSSHRFYSHEGKAFNATHWQPLPEPPK